jgi:large subunit ribosomal protein L10
MNREEKSQLVEDLRTTLGDSKFLSIVHYSGMSDKQLYDMRVELKSKNCNMKVAKNKLVKIAVQGTDLEILQPHLVGPTALLYSQDPVALAKLVTEKAKKVESLKIITGYLDKNLVEESKMQDLAKLGSLEEVRANFVGKLKAVQTGFVRNINFHQTSLVSLIKNYSSQKEG